MVEYLVVLGAVALTALSGYMFFGEMVIGKLYSYMSCPDDTCIPHTAGH
jgi:hypothetical protein